MLPSALEHYLHDHIPLSQALGVRVVAAAPDEVALSAPLEPNINHRQTVFGGSASAVAILAAWTLLYVRLEEAGLLARVVIQENTMRYEQPMAAAFNAVAAAPEAQRWQKFLDTLKRKKRARITVDVTLFCAGQRCGSLTGDFVALG